MSYVAVKLGKGGKLLIQDCLDGIDTRLLLRVHKIWKSFTWEPHENDIRNSLVCR